MILLWESEPSWEGHAFPWTVSAPSSVSMSQMIGCASRGLGTWPDTGPLGTEVWATGGADGGRTGQGTGEWEEAEAKCRGVGWEICSLWALSLAALGTDSRGRRGR